MNKLRFCTALIMTTTLCASYAVAKEVPPMAKGGSCNYSGKFTQHDSNGDALQDKQLVEGTLMWKIEDGIIRFTDSNNPYRPGNYYKYEGLTKETISASHFLADLIEIVQGNQDKSGFSILATKANNYKIPYYLKALAPTKYSGQYTMSLDDTSGNFKRLTFNLANTSCKKSCFYYDYTYTIDLDPKSGPQYASFEGKNIHFDNRGDTIDDGEWGEQVDLSNCLSY